VVDPSEIIKSLNAPVGVDQVLSPRKKVVPEAVPVADRSPEIVPVAVIVPPVTSTNVPELVATEVTVPVLVVHPASLLNIDNGMVEICVLAVVVPSTTAKSSVPTNVPEADNESKSKSIVPVVVMGPPDKPVPEPTEVTVPTN